MVLTAQERERIATRVARVEAKTGAQVVTAVVGKSDNYPEIPWQAFALGVVVAGAALTAASFAEPAWQTGDPALAHAVIILCAGAAAHLLSVFVRPVARLFLDRQRGELEVTQHAHSLFFTRRLDRTRGHVGVLILLSLFERRVVILPDSGFEPAIGRADWERLVNRITLLLGNRDLGGALHAGLDGLEALLLERGFHGGPGLENELPNAIVEEGPKR